MKKVIFVVLAAFCLSILYSKSGFCYRIPPEESKIRDLYMFGKDGKRSYGAKPEPQVIFLRVPDDYSGKIKISIYDPDIGGYVDEKSGKWNTETRFSIYGGSRAYSSLQGLTDRKVEDFFQGKLLDEQTFGEDGDYDKKFYYFDPIDADEGEKVDGHRYFKLVVEGLSGDDNNVYSLDVSPDAVEAFGYTLSLRLSERRGDKMALYPEVPLNTARLVEYNYDLDANGGTIDIISASKSYQINRSGTGVWENTEIDVEPSDTGRRWVYEITKDTQPNANMAMYITTGEGKAVPVFFKPGPAGPKMVFVEKKEEQPWVESKISCNTFTFDGSKSYDPDNQELSYFWDFGDGSTSSQIRSMHTYKEAGKYLIRLTVTDNSDAECNTATTQHVIKVNEPPCAIANGPNISCVNTETFFDASQSTDSPEDKLTYRWDFGDGETEEGIKVTHKYEKGGDYIVTLTVTDDSGSMCDTGIDKLNISVNTPPVADAGDDVVMCKENPYDPLEVTFDASRSKDADGNDLSFIWDFGDGETSEGIKVTHKYSKGGEYIAKLLVTDNTDTSCSKATDTRLIRLNRAPMADAGENISICLAEKAKFDGANSFDNDEDILGYTWDFGDGETALGKTASHKYAKGGLYKVILTVSDNTKTDCSSSSEIILVDVNSSPSASVAALDVSCLGQMVRFDGSSSADPDGDRLMYTWDFGDGTTATGAEIKHGYAKGGLYKATLFIDDGKNSDCSGSTKVHYVNVNTPPIAEAGSDLTVCVKDGVEFDASKSYDPDNDTLTYIWDFGDGETAEGQKVTHVYKKIGVYKAALTIKDDSGSECDNSVDTLITTVNAEPVPVIEVI